ncbi:hypothetical protein CATRI_06675 [Corynebacterium atrinae]|uniref:hypothetical protein n=1 Tax=Corynebacterium atrinae TaxID=1336740 RepID=UPI0025B5E019|nr:hypothetical protein [Corynebacterium atrinae]WJY63416.1 hypothetical protein CATRI_06675 [Corynebacterium atrinae]
MSQGAYVSFLGIDGIDKTTLARAFRDELVALGVKVEEVSWRSTNREGRQSWPTDALQELWVETFRLLFGGSTTAGKPLALPRDFASWEGGGWEDKLGEMSLTSAHRSGPMAAALAELSGNLVLTDAVIRPLVDSGTVVIQETFPYKHVLKEILVARQISDEPRFTGMCDLLGSVILDVFGSAHMQPDLGVFVDRDPYLAHAWRMNETGRLGLLEDFGAAGDRGRESYLQLQEQSASYFSAAATSWGWETHVVDNSGLDANLSRGLDLLMTSPTVSRILT